MPNKTRNPLKKEAKKEESFLSPLRELIEISGPMTYNESAQAWNIIRLRKDILHEFPELKDKQASFTYRLTIPRTSKAMKRHFEEATKSEEILPIFLSFAKVTKTDENIPKQ